MMTKFQKGSHSWDQS